MKMTNAQPTAPSTEACKWYVVQTKPHQEARVEANLATLGLETLRPQTRVAPRGARRNPRIETLFPSYLFARFDVLTLGGKVRYTRGVARILGTDASGPTSVDDAIVEEVRGRIGSDGFVKLATLEAGDRVRITNGLLRDFVGVFEPSTLAAGRIRLLLSTLHSQIRVNIEDRFVEKVLPLAV